MWASQTGPSCWTMTIALIGFRSPCSKRCSHVPRSTVTRSLRGSASAPHKCSFNFGIESRARSPARAFTYSLSTRTAASMSQLIYGRNSVAPRWQYRQCWLQQQATRSARLPSSRPARDLRHVVAAGSPRIPYWALSMTRRWASASALDCECEDHSRMRNSLIPCRHRLRLKQRHSNGRGSNCSQHPVRRCVLSAKVAAIRRRPLLHRKAVTPTG